LYIKTLYKCKSVANNLLELGCNIQEAIKHEDTLIYYLQEQEDWKGRTTLEIIAQNRFYDYLKHPVVANMVSKLWYGNDGVGGIWSFSTIVNLLFSNIKKESFKDIVDSVELEQAKNEYEFQFKLYVNNCSQRNIINSVSQVIAAIIFEGIIVMYVELSLSGENPLDNDLFIFIDKLANILIFSINVNFAFLIIYLFKTGRKIEFNIDMFIEIILFIATLLNYLDFSLLIQPMQEYVQGLFYKSTYYESDNLANQYLLNSTNISQKFNFNNMEPVYETIEAVPKETYKTKNSKLINTLIYSIIILCAWFKVILVMITTRTFGPFLRILYLLFGMMISFGLIYFCFNMVWAQAMTLIFYNDNNDFLYFFNSFVSLFNATFGQYDLKNYRTSPLLGYIFSVLYVIMANIMLLSLFVAIVSNQYKTHTTEAESENRVILIKTQEKIKWDRKWGFLILLPPPLNVMSFFLGIILLLFVPESKLEKVNLALSKFCFIFICFFNFAYLFVISIVLYPFAVLKSYIHTIKDSVSEMSGEMFFKGILALFTRPFLMLFYIVSDWVIFWKICYKEKEENVDDEKKKIILEKNVICNIRKVLHKNQYQLKKKKIHISEILKEFNLCVAKDTYVGNVAETDQNNTSKDINSQTSTNLPESVTVNENTFPNELMNSVPKDEKDDSNVDIFSHDNSQLTAKEEKSLIEICNKFTDKENFIDISRTLVLLENRLWPSNNYKKYIEHLKMKSLLSGVLNFHYKSVIGSKNYLFEYKKIGHVLYKINLKLQLLMTFIPQDYESTFVSEFERLNQMYLGKKNYAYLKNLDDKDAMSDNDDVEVYKKKKDIPKITYFQTSQNNRKNIDKLTNLLTLKSSTNMTVQFPKKA